MPTLREQLSTLQKMGYCIGQSPSTHDGVRDAVQSGLVQAVHDLSKRLEDLQKASTIHQRR